MGVRLRQYDTEKWRRWVTVEEEELRNSEAVEKVITTGGSGMIIGGKLCLFLLQTFPLLLASPSFYPFHGRLNHKFSKQV